MPLWNHIEGVMGAAVAAGASCALLITAAADAARPETVEPGPAGCKGGNLTFPNQNCLNLLTFGLTGSVLLLHLSCNPP